MKRLHNKTILIIDDDAGMLCALDKVLSAEGATVIPTVWAGDAIDILTSRREQIDLVITDLRMPILTGVTVVFAVREVFPDMPVIVLTAYSSPDIEEECFRQGARAVLEKPLDTPQLLHAIEKVFASVKASV